MEIDKFKKKLFGSNETEEDETEEIANSKDKNLFKEIGGNLSKMILFEPRAYSESQQISDYLKNKNAVVVNLKRVTPDQAKRIVDFLSGTIYAIDGGLQKLGGGIFLCTPKNINVEGKITDEVANKVGIKKPKQEKDEEEFDW